ncbi:putative reverse transcriptase zinc-binding domain-containing protein [Helianthus annuus]|nr:putative reverse transcriptase zinc-binding domain-containing protein [Helianthus annuus]
MGGCLDKNKVSWVPWFKVLAPKEHGGLGIGSLSSTNIALLVKWRIRFKNEPNQLWSRVVKAIHHGQRTWLSIPAKATNPGVWNNIIKAGKNLCQKNIDVDNKLVVSLGRGDKTLFWIDKWATTQPLKIIFPNLFSAQSDKKCTVQQRYMIQGGNTNWFWGGAQPISLTRDANDWESCLQLLHNINIKENEVDSWLWQGAEGPEFYTVRNLRRELDFIERIAETKVLTWLNWTPLKVNCFLWRAVQNRIPTREALMIRNITLPTILCPLCNNRTETTDHILISCEFANYVWLQIFSWIKVPMPQFLISVVELFEFIRTYPIYKVNKKAMYVILTTTCWMIWKTRNELIFKGTNSSVSKIIGEVKACSFLWIRSRANVQELDWAKWRGFSFNKFPL